MAQDNEIPELFWRSQKTVRADLLTNRDFSHTLIKIGIIFFVLLYGSQLLPNAHEIRSSIPEKWNKTDTLQLHEVSALNRYIKIYAMPANNSDEMDLIHEVDVFSLKDNQQHQKKLTVRVADMDDFIDISDGSLKFYFGQLRILDQVAYSINIQKPLKLSRLLQNQPSDNSNAASQKNSSQSSIPVEKEGGQVNNTAPGQIGQKEKIQEKQENQEKQEKQEKQIDQQMKNKQQQEQKAKKEEEQKRKKEEEQKRKQQQQQKRKQEQQQQKRKKEEEEKKAKEQEQQRQRMEEQRKRKEEEAERQKLYDYTNIKIEVQLMSGFGTVLQLFVRYVSILLIIYVAADNPDAPKSLPIICVIISNPLLFLQISYPNRISDLIDSICISGPFLYIPAWLFYIHTNITFHQTKHQAYLAIKTGLGILLYILNILRLLDFSVFFLQVAITIPLTFFLGSYLWEAFLDLHHQHHRDKVLIMVTLCYIAGLLALKSVFIEWKYLLTYILHQIYGLYIIYLLGSPEKAKKKNSKKEVNQRQSMKMEQIQLEEVKSAESGLK